MFLDRPLVLCLRIMARSGAVFAAALLWRRRVMHWIYTTNHTYPTAHISVRWLRQIQCAFCWERPRLKTWTLNVLVGNALVWKGYLTWALTSRPHAVTHVREVRLCLRCDLPVTGGSVSDGTCRGRRQRISSWNALWHRLRRQPIHTILQHRPKDR